MLRQLLTLLAVFTGLAAACEPARAGAHEVEQVRLEPGAQVAAVNAIAARIVQGEQRAVAAALVDPVRLEPSRVVPVPAVLLGIDRAHE